LDIGSVPRAQLVALSDPDEARLHDVAAKTGSPTCYTDPMRLIADDAVDVVIVASPDNTHAAFTMKALELGKPVFCEKPLASTVSEALSIIEKEVAIGQKLVSVGFNRRFDPAHVAVKEMIDSGKIGRPLLWKGAHRNASAMYQTDGAFILNNSAGHDVDSARWLLGSSVKSVYTWGLRSHEELDVTARDLLFVNMEMENGTRAVAEVYVNARYGYEVQVEMVCQDGVVSSVPRQPTIVRHDNNRGAFISEDFRAYFIDSYAREITHWLQSLQEGTPFIGADAWDGYCVMATTEAAGKSLQTGTSVPVQTVEQPALYR
jgi:myo-inositol 2-dehydrogenase/D-chiro-inositol 1-dehydrogenase